MYLDNKEKFKKFMELLPEQAVEDFLNKLLLVGKFKDEYMIMFSNYDTYSNEILSQFTNSKINTEWETFNTSFHALQGFLQENYSLPNGFYTKHSPEWENNIEELKKFGKDFEEKYTNFILLSKKELENNEIGNKEIQSGKIKEEKLQISYNTNLGQFTFNKKSLIELEGKQKDTADCLVNAGKDVKVSWDEIQETFKDSTSDLDIPNSAEIDTQKRSVRTAITEINNHARLYLQTMDLVGAKDNEYWLQYEVDKGR